MANGIGYNSQPKVSNVNSLSEPDKKKLKDIIQEMNNSLTRVAAERELQKEMLTKAAEELGLDKKLVRRMSKVYFRSNFSEEVESDNAFQDFYEMVINKGTV